MEAVLIEKRTLLVFLFQLALWLALAVGLKSARAVLSACGKLVGFLVAETVVRVLVRACSDVYTLVYPKGFAVAVFERGLKRLVL